MTFMCDKCKIHKFKNTNCFLKDPTYAIFLKTAQVYQITISSSSARRVKQVKVKDVLSPLAHS